MSERPDCYKCRWRRDVLGSAHSACVHPHKDATLSDILGHPMQPHRPRLTIRAKEHGVKHGWFTWPVDFDPIWLEECDGFTPPEDSP